jgi:hypothetical protein
MRRLSFVLAVASLGFAGASFHFMYRAGCIGDLKGGSLGDFKQALDVESEGVLLLLLSVLLAAIAGVAYPVKLWKRVLKSVVLFATVAIGGYIAGIQFEVWGVQYCLGTEMPQ